MYVECLTALGGVISCGQGRSHKEISGESLDIRRGSIDFWSSFFYVFRFL